jgi:CRP-like cAMP-binding protein
MKQQSGALSMAELYQYLPANMVERIMYDINKHIIRSVPIFAEANDNFIQSVSTKLKPEIYLPGDYIIYKGDIGEEMFFIAEGSVDVLTPDNKHVKIKLGKKDYIGELALLNKITR